jgi:hypothetical protein
MSDSFRPGVAVNLTMFPAVPVVPVPGAMMTIRRKYGKADEGRAFPARGGVRPLIFIYCCGPRPGRKLSENQMSLVA